MTLARSSRRYFDPRFDATIITVAPGEHEITSAKDEIVVDDHGRTSVPGVFAAGDCTTVPYKQIVVAMGAGSTAALGAFDHLIRTPVPEQASPQLAVA